MPRGGRRAGTPGSTYSNRKDLATSQPVRTVTGQTYGQATAQAQAQKVVPLPTQNADVPQLQGQGTGGQVQPPAGPAPGTLTPLNAPTSRPTEPVTHGSPTGPGAGPEVLGLIPGSSADIDSQLRALYSAFPSEDLRQLIEDHGTRRV